MMGQFLEKNGSYFYYSPAFLARLESCRDNINLKKRLENFLENFSEQTYAQSQQLGNAIYRNPPARSGWHDFTVFFYKSNGAVSAHQTQSEIPPLHVIDHFYRTSDQSECLVKDELTRNAAPVRQDETEIQAEFALWLEAQAKAKKQHAQALAQLKMTELQQKTEWLQDFKIKTHFEIFETHDWITAMRAPELQDYRIWVYAALKEIYEYREEDGVFEYIHPERKLFLWSHEQVTLLCETALISEGKTVLLLHNVVYGQAPDMIAQMKDRALASKYNFKLSRGRYDLHEISRVSDRAYPDFLLKNEKLWIEIEKTDDNSSNLSLLPAQIEILEKLHFPVFINGQAGSGKSTLLFYLFADLCYLKLMGDQPQDQILFITENQRLLEKSRDEIVEILAYNPSYDLLAEKFSGVDAEGRKKKIFAEIKDSFSTLKQFMLAQTTSQQLDQFSEENFVNFYRFKAEYLKSPSISKQFRTKYSPEMAWYVIRTFIKGYAKDRHLSPENFHEIPAKDRKNILLEDFENIYETAWKGFYLPRQNQDGLWDHLDLVRALFETNQDFGRHAFIICDESQDFTKLELELLINCLNIAQGYDLSQLDRFPLVFAGDPFQTVNPTGFSWQRLKSMFTEEIIQRYDLRMSQEHQKAMVRELEINYRSTPELVKIANAIQFFRIDQLQTDLALPQDTRQYASGKRAYLMAIPDGGNLALQQNIESMIVIIPCEMGEEEHFKLEDGVEKLNYSMLSAGLVKGLEEPKIAVYKFGQHFVEEFLSPDGKTLSLEECLHLHQPNSNAFFRMAYFFNKLYVAVTRAREELYLIDTETGIEKFWKPLQALIAHSLQENGLHHDNQNKMENRAAWQAALLEAGCLSLYSDSLPEMTHLKDAERWQEEFDNANKWLKQHIEEENPELILRVCLPAFFRADHIDSTKFTREGIAKCEAYSALFQEEWLKAGDAFVRLEEFEQAKSAYWYLGEWQKIESLQTNEQTELNPLEQFILDFMRQKPFVLSQFLNAMQYGKAENKLSLLEDSRIRWKNKDNFIPTLANRIREQQISDLHTYAELAEAMASIQIHHSKWRRLIGDCFVKAENYLQALKYYDPQADQNHPEYLRAKSKDQEGTLREQLARAIEILENRHSDALAKAESKSKLLELYQEQTELFNEDPARKWLLSILWERSSEGFEELIAVVDGLRSQNKLSWKQLLATATSMVKLNRFVHTWVEHLKAKNKLDWIDLNSVMAFSVYHENFKRYTRNTRLGGVRPADLKELEPLAEALSHLFAYSQLQPSQVDSMGEFSVVKILQVYIRNYLSQKQEAISLPYVLTLIERSEAYFGTIAKQIEALMQRKGLSEGDVAYLQVRLLKVKAKQIKHIQANPTPGKKNDTSGLEKELKELLAKSGLNLKVEEVYTQALPDYPDPDYLPEIPAPAPAVGASPLTHEPDLETVADPNVDSVANTDSGPIEAEPEVLPLDPASSGEMAPLVAPPMSEASEVMPLALPSEASSEPERTHKPDTLPRIWAMQNQIRHLEASLLQQQQGLNTLRQEMDQLLQDCLSEK
ncbi:MAG: hypothetical protein IV090_17055 [Candidatus Sericytochromatia bacterium]|nr:hypothetical protein [Candidatus Sericytochromatia bacterium]